MSVVPDSNSSSSITGLAMYLLGLVQSKNVRPFLKIIKNFIAMIAECWSKCGALVVASCTDHTPGEQTPLHCHLNLFQMAFMLHKFNKHSSCQYQPWFHWLKSNSQFSTSFHWTHEWTLTEWPLPSSGSTWHTWFQNTLLHSLSTSVGAAFFSLIFWFLLVVGRLLVPQRYPCFNSANLLLCYLPLYSQWCC